MALGIDASTSHVGLALLRERPGGRAELLQLGSVRGDGVEGVRAQAQRVAVVVSGWAETLDLDLTDCRVRIERAPRTARGDVQHGKQAALGWALGYVAGVVEVVLDRSIHDLRAAELVEVRDWRANMLELSSRWGRPATKPSRKDRADIVHIESIERVEGTNKAEVRFSCGHVETVEREILLAGCRCTTCPKPQRSDVGAAWKRLACALVEHHFSERYAQLVEPARRRARTPRSDHELEGISDACEAVWIAASALTSDR